MDPEKFYILHSTPIGNLENILKVGGLFPISESKQKDNWDGLEYVLSNKRARERYESQIFTTLVFRKDEEGFYLFNPDKDKKFFAYLFFNPEIVDKYPNHFCENWYYGKYYSGWCTKYNLKKSYLDNLKKYKNFYIKRRGKFSHYKNAKKYLKSSYGSTPDFGELVFNMKDMKNKKISLKDLFFIYIPNREFFHFFKEAYPEYPFANRIKL